MIRFRVPYYDFMDFMEATESGQDYEVLCDAEDGTVSVWPEREMQPTAECFVLVECEDFRAMLTAGFYKPKRFLGRVRVEAFES